MDTPEFLSIVPQMAQDQTLYSVECYADVDDAHYDYQSTVLDVHSEEILVPNLRDSNNLFDSRPEDLLNVKIESVEGNDSVFKATEDESMAVEALRQLGNSSYAQNHHLSCETAQQTDLPPLVCASCDLQLHTSSALNDHLAVCGHSQHLCSICNEVFERKLDLNNHLVCHAVERPHACRICSTLFVHKNDLQQHILTHESLTKNDCQICGQQFSRNSSLTNHMKIHNYQPGRALMNTKIEGTNELADILTGNSDPEMQPLEKVTLPSINNIALINNWNLCYEPENFNADISLDVTDDMHLDEKLDMHMKLEAPKPNIDNSIDKNKPYACNKCTKTFAREKALINHLKLHKIVLDNFFICERCDQTFNNSSSLDKHLQFCGIKTKSKEIKPATATTTKVLSSIIIKKKEPIKVPPTETPQDTGCDVNVYNKIYKHRCTECTKRFSTKQKLFRHMWIHRKKVYSCELCTKTFEQQVLLDEHRLATHKSVSPYVCQECGKNFSTRQGLWEHNRIHTTDTNSFKCQECAKTFTSRQGFLIHKRKHTDERPYGCRFCWKAFRDGGTLRKHERIHTGERPHACPLCSKAFNQKVVLREHIRWLHTANLTPDSDGLFNCKICDKNINDKDELCAHIVRHSDQMAQLARDASKSNINNKSKAEVREVLPKSDAAELKIGNLKAEVDIEIPLIEIPDTSDITEDINSTVYIEKMDENVSNKEMLAMIGIECDLCGDIFVNKIQLNEHIRIHIA